MGKTKKETASKKALTMAQHRARHGVFTTTAVLTVIILVVALNVFLSTKNWTFDFTSNKMYTLSEQSKKIAGQASKDKKVNIYYLNKESATATAYVSILSQYEKASKYIDIQYKDLELYPNFATKYLSDGQTAAANDMIVVSGDRYRYISSSEYYTSSYDESGNTTTSINIEPKVTSAIDYVMSEEVPTVYTLSGQGESDLGTNLSDALENDNYDIQELEIVSTGGIPKDCDLLFINAPTADLDDTIIDMISEYMDNGGKLYVVLDPSQMYENLNGLLAKYGVKVQEGIVVETGSGYYMGQYPTYLLPTISSHEITTTISSAGLQILAPVSKAFVSDPEVTDYTVTDLLVTSAESYSKVDTQAADFAKEKGDIDGPLAVAQVVENADGEGVLVVCGCSSLGLDEIDSYVSGANTNLASNAINYLTKQESKIAVKATTLDNSYALFSAFASKMVMAIGIIAIPLFLIVIGLVVWIVRKRA